MSALPCDGPVSRHFGAVIKANAAAGPGRGPAPAPGPDRWWWFRWRMFDALMWEALESLRQEQFRHVMANWPARWPSPESGLLSIRQMEWVRVTMIGGRELDVRGRLFA